MYGSLKIYKKINKKKSRIRPGKIFFALHFRESWAGHDIQRFGETVHCTVLYFRRRWRLCKKICSLGDRRHSLLQDRDRFGRNWPRVSCICIFRATELEGCQYSPAYNKMEQAGHNDIKAGQKSWSGLVSLMLPLARLRSSSILKRRTTRACADQLSRNMTNIL